jgi:hypothetical protein
MREQRLVIRECAINKQNGVTSVADGKVAISYNVPKLV